MKKILYTILSFIVVSFAACEQSGWDSDNMYLDKKFQSITNVNGEGGYGNAMLTWSLPDSTSSLNLIDIRWTSEKGDGHKIFSKYSDTIWIDSLKEAMYTFEVVSKALNGEEISSPELILPVADWQKEPAADIESFKPMVAMNFIFLDWVHPIHSTYAGVKFQVYSNSDVIKEVYVSKDETPKAEFELETETEYELVYNSINILDSISPSFSYEFMTGKQAPEVPEEISVNLSRIDYAHSADITWSKTEKMDSLLIKYTDLNAEERTYIFGGSSGYLSLLPGGTVKIQVQAKGTNGTWSLAVEKSIKTKLKEQSLDIKDGKVKECLNEKIGRSPASINGFSFQELSGIKTVTMRYQIDDISEVELLVNLEELYVQASYPPGTNIAPTVQEFRLLVSRLPKIRTLKIDSGWPFAKDIQKAFENDPKIEFILN